MTVYNWSSMSPRERDALVAEKVMGLRENKSIFYSAMAAPYYCITEDGVDIVERDGERYNQYEFRPSSDISAAWEVVERMKTLSCSQQEVFHDETNYTLFNIAPEAICRAALKAVGVDIQ